MESFLTGLLENSRMPVISAFILGLMTAISPCPMATNITAIGFISRDAGRQRRVFLNGLIYTAGRAISYTLLGIIFFIGADQLKLSGLFQKYGEKFIGPLLIIIGVFMLDVLKFSFPGFSRISNHFESKGTGSAGDALLLGMLFAMAFCPYSGVLYFGMLIPMTISSVAGLYLPVVFAIATGIPVIIFAWLLAYTVSGVGRFYNRLKSFETWFRRIIALVFIGIGIYYVLVIYF